MTTENSVIEDIERGGRNYAKTYFVLIFGGERRVLTTLPNGWGNEIMVARSGDKFFGATNRTLDKLTFYNEDRLWIVDKINTNGIGVRIGVELYYIEEDLREDRIIFEGQLDVTSCEITQHSITASLIEIGSISDFLNNVKEKQTIKAVNAKFLTLSPRTRDISATLKYEGVYYKGGEAPGEGNVVGVNWQNYPTPGNFFSTTWMFSNEPLPTGVAKISVIDEKDYDEDVFNFSLKNYPESILSDGKDGFAQNFFAGYGGNSIKSYKNFLLKNVVINYNFRAYTDDARRGGNISQATEVRFFIAFKKEIRYKTNIDGNVRTAQPSEKILITTVILEGYADLQKPPINAASEFNAGIKLTFSDSGRPDYIGEGKDWFSTPSIYTNRRVNNKFIKAEVDILRIFFEQESSADNSYNIEVEVFNRKSETGGMDLGQRVSVNFEGLQVESNIGILPKMNVKAIPLTTALREAIKTASPSIILDENNVSAWLTFAHIASESMINYSLVRPSMQTVTLSVDDFFNFLLRTFGIVWRFKRNVKNTIELVRLEDLLNYNNNFNIIPISTQKIDVVPDIQHSTYSVGRVLPQNANVPIFDPTNGADFTVFKRSRQGQPISENRGEEKNLTHNWRSGGSDITPILRSAYENSVNPSTSPATYSPSNIYYFEASDGANIDNLLTRNDYIANPDNFDGTSEQKINLANEANRKIQLENDFGIFINPKQRLFFHENGSYGGILVRLRYYLNLYAIMYNGLSIASLKGTITQDVYEMLIYWDTGQNYGNIPNAKNFMLIGIKETVNVEYNDTIRDMVMNGRIDGFAIAGNRLVLITALKMNFATTLCTVEYYPVSTPLAELPAQPIVAKPTVSVLLITFTAITFEYNLTSNFSTFKVFDANTNLLLNIGEYKLNELNRTITFENLNYSITKSIFIKERLINGKIINGDSISATTLRQPTIRLNDGGDTNNVPQGGGLNTFLIESEAPVNPNNLDTRNNPPTLLGIDGIFPITGYFPNGYWTVCLAGPVFNLRGAGYGDTYTVAALQRVENQYISGGIDSAYTNSLDIKIEDEPLPDIYTYTWSLGGKININITRDMTMKVIVVGSGGDGSKGQYFSENKFQGGGGGGGGGANEAVYDLKTGDVMTLENNTEGNSVYKDTRGNQLSGAPGGYGSGSEGGKGGIGNHSTGTDGTNGGINKIGFGGSGALGYGDGGSGGTGLDPEQTGGIGAVILREIR